MMNKIKKYWRTTLAIAIIILLSISTYNNYIKLHDYENIVNVQNDSIEHLINKNGEHVARIKSFEIDNQKNFLKINFQDSLINELQYTVKKYKKENIQFAAIIKSYAEIDTTAKVEYIVTEVPTQPLYKWSLNTEWYRMLGETNHEKSKVNLKFYDSKSIVSYIKKKNIITEVTDHNPYSSTYGLRSYTSKAPKQKKFGIGPNIGWSPWNGVYGGIGINYNIIELW